MLIKSLELKEFGPIKILKKTFANTPVIGVVGPNGSGKSNLLRSIKYALTTELEEGDIGSYVRDVEGASNASVRFVFQKNSNEGRIYRRIGKSPERKIEWDGKSETADAKSKALLREVFQADGEAVASAVFIEQGQFDKVLFGTPAEREELFMKLLLLSHMGKVESAAEKRMKALAGQIVDLGALIDNQRNVLVSAETNAAQLTVALAQVPDQTILTDAVRELDSAMRMVEQLEWAKRVKEESLFKVKAKVGEGFQDYDLNAAATEEAALTRELESISAALLAAAAQKNDILRRDELTAIVNDYMREDVKVRRELKDLENELAVIPERTELERNIANWDIITQVKLNVAAAEAKLANCNKQCSDIQARSGLVTRAEDEAGTLEAQRSDVAEAVGDLKMQLTVAETVMHLAQGHSSEHCPACQSPLSAEMQARFTAEYVQRMKKTLAEKQQDHKRISEGVVARKNEIASHQHSLNYAVQAYTDAELELRGLQARLAATTLIQPADSKVTLQELLTKRVSLSSQLPGIVASLNKVERSNDVAQKELFNILPRLQGVTATVKEINLRTTAQIAQQQPLKQKRENLRIAISEFRSVQKELSEAQAALDSVNTQIAEHSAVRNTAYAVLQKLSPGWQPVDLQEELRTLKEANNKRQVVIGEIRQAEFAVVAAKGDLVELIKRDEKQLKIRQALTDMEMVKKMFARRGLPKSYMEYRFQDLIPYTQEVLGTFGADFHVTPDPDDSLAFRFIRTTTPGVNSLPQFKLSGGQRVRLTIAFLLAVQRVILPEIGLLVLDEPSLHLDQEGKEGLRDLLIGLQQRLQNSEMQLVVCDHEPLLRTAFNATIDLGALKD